MKLYRLHDVLRAAALAWMVSACGTEPGSNGGSADTSSADTGGGTDTAQADTANDDTTAEDTTAEDTTAEDTTAEDTTADDTTAEDTTAADTAAEDTAAEDTAAEDTAAEDTTAADATAEDTTVADSASNDTTATDTASNDTATNDTASDGGSNPPSAYPCVNPKPIMVNGVDVGVDTCDNGMVRRREVVACPAFVPDPNSTCSIGSGSTNGCQSDNDCVGKGDGPCLPGLGTPWCFCQQTCKTDADCGTGSVCLCGPSYGTCMTATCTDSHDCKVGDCVTHDTNPGCGGKALACQTAEDLCGGPKDCPSDKPFCAIENGAQSGKHVCEPYMCAIGRPFEVAGSWRSADPVDREDWQADGASSLESAFSALDAKGRAALASHWLDAARMEHASVASFARLTLELLAVGAPAELLARSQQAGIDEVRHAQACYSLAQALGAGDVGPGALPIDGSLRAPTLVEVAAAAAREGCVWETVAALQAQVEAVQARHPALQAWLQPIADDEGRHAELAWDIVRWAVEVGGAPVRDAVVAALDEAEDALLAPVQAPVLPQGYGALGGADLGALRRHAVAAVVTPQRERAGLGRAVMA